MKALMYWICLWSLLKLIWLGRSVLCCCYCTLCAALAPAAYMQCVHILHSLKLYNTGNVQWVFLCGESQITLSWMGGNLHIYIPQLLTGWEVSITSSKWKCIFTATVAMPGMVLFHHCMFCFYGYFGKLGFMTTPNNLCYSPWMAECYCYKEYL